MSECFRMVCHAECVAGNRVIKKIYSGIVKGTRTGVRPSQK